MTTREKKGSLLDAQLKDEKTIQSRDFFLWEVFFLFPYPQCLPASWGEKLVQFPQTWFEVSKK